MSRLDLRAHKPPVLIDLMVPDGLYVLRVAATVTPEGYWLRYPGGT